MLNLKFDDEVIEHIASLPPEVGAKLVRDLREFYHHSKYNKAERYFTDDGSANDKKHYPRHWEFMQQGKNYKLRAFIAPNRVGKSFTGGTETTTHLTGQYPDNWDGFVINHAPTVWGISTNPDTLRQGMQLLLFGAAKGSEFGTGLIPKKLIVGDPELKTGVKNLIQTAYIKHTSGELSEIHFKTGKQERTAFEAAAIDFAWLDEEIDDEIFSEVVVRLVTKKGRLIFTFTPLKGITNTVMKFLPDGQFPNTPTECGPVVENEDNKGLNAWITYVDWDRAPHLTKEDRDLLWAACPPHLREARTQGRPAVGAGRVFPIEDSRVIIDNIPISPHWPRVKGADFGWNATACLWAAYDEATDKVYIYDEYQDGDKQVPIHASVIKSKGFWIPGVADPSGNKANPQTGARTLEIFNEHGCNLIAAKNDIDLSIALIWDRLVTGRLKFMRSCTKLAGQFRVFRFNDKGKIAANQNDHLIDCLRYIILSGLGVMCTMPDEDEERQRRREYLQSGSTRNSITGY